MHIATSLFAKITNNQNYQGKDSIFVFQKCSYGTFKQTNQNTCIILLVKTKNLENIVLFSTLT